MAPAAGPERFHVSHTSANRIGPLRLAARTGVAACIAHPILNRCGMPALATLDRATSEPVRRYGCARPDGLLYKDLGGIPKPAATRFSGPCGRPHTPQGMGPPPARHLRPRTPGSVSRSSCIDTTTPDPTPASAAKHQPATSPASPDSGPSGTGRRRTRPAARLRCLASPRHDVLREPDFLTPSCAAKLLRRNRSTADVASEAPRGHDTRRTVRAIRAGPGLVTPRANQNSAWPSETQRGAL